MTSARTGDARPTAEQMLARTELAAPPGRGRLRVYLGMAPGVGKTYTALEEAHRRAERGTDIVVGFVEAHGRQKTIDLQEGLEVVPRTRIEYRGVVVEEMDTAAVIARHPAVAVIDELAHTNVPGSPREKRWEDVDLIRDAGIHVISTCNVQHVESVAEAVETIIGVPVHERLPDEVIAAADEIELVDMSPHALRQRMRHGNVYPPDRTAVALEKFFTEANLSALRDLTLRFVARRADEQLQGVAGAQGFERLTNVAERVMVVITENSAMHRAIRRAAALASDLRAPFVATFIETPDTARLPADRARDLRQLLDYAADLGAEVVRAEASDLPLGLERVAHDRRITHVVLAHTPRSSVDRLLRRSLADELLTRLPELEVHLVGTGRE